MSKREVVKKRLDVSEIIRINRERNEERNKPYEPVTGLGSDTIPRTEIHLSDSPIGDTIYVPNEMLQYSAIANAINVGSIKDSLNEGGLYATEENMVEWWRAFVKLRVQYDFEFWAASFVVIQDKETARDIPFVLNHGQRKLLKKLESMRRQGKPIRIILLKARQWGGSTLIQIYIAWLQLVHKTQWSSVICAHTENTARNVRGMYSKLLENYPLWLCDATDRSEIKLSNYESSQKTKIIKNRGCRISIGSAVKPEGLRGLDVACAHLSEVGLYPSTMQTKPEDLVQSICSGIAYKPNTLIVYESTAKGVGNFYHKEWCRSNASDPKERSLFAPLFVAWHEILLYQMEVDNLIDFAKSLSDDEYKLFEDGATLEGIAWWRDKRLEYSDIWRFRSEFPSTPDEAFQSTGHPFYNPDDVKRLESTCCEPKHIGELVGNSDFGSQDALEGLHFSVNPRGNFKVWAEPDYEERVTDRYVVVVDIGGQSERADRSVICVFDRYHMKDVGGVPEVVAEWAGHIAHYKLAWLAVKIATWYHEALLVIESNTLESHQTEGVHSEFIMTEISDYYDNLYCRTPAEQVRQGLPPKWGFHTNKQTKTMVCDHQKKALENSLYLERCIEAVNEHRTLEIKANGEIGATDGAHDDRHIVRAIGVWVCYEYLSAPESLDRIQEDQVWSKDITSMASF